jgi:hypothetical protein
MPKLEGMGNDGNATVQAAVPAAFPCLAGGTPVTTASSAFACHAKPPRRRVLWHSFDIRDSTFVIFRAVIGMLIAQTCCTRLSQAQSMNLVGRWNIEIAFANGNRRALHFDVQGEGKGFFEVVDARAKVWGAGTHSEAKWTLNEGNSVTFTGPAEFMLGNVGRDAGTLMFKGKFENADLVTGEVEFAPRVGDRPSKHGTFKATRAGG